MSGLLVVRCLSPAADSLHVRIPGRQVPKPRCLSPAANSLYSRIAHGWLPKNIVWGPRAGFIWYTVTPGSNLIVQLARVPCCCQISFSLWSCGLQQPPNSKKCRCAFPANLGRTRPKKERSCRLSSSHPGPTRPQSNKSLHYSRKTISNSSL